MAKGKTRAKLLANVDEDIANENTDGVTLSELDEILNERRR
jgi:hypothetical protein